MVWGYHVEAHPHQLQNGKYKRKVKYIDTKGKDHDRDFLTDSDGNFKSKVYGGVNGDGTPVCDSKDEAEREADIHMESRKFLNKDKKKQSAKETRETKKKLKALEAEGKRYRVALKGGKGYIKHNGHYVNKEAVASSYKGTQHYQQSQARVNALAGALQARQAAAGGGGQGEIRHNPNVRPPFAQH